METQVLVMDRLFFIASSFFKVNNEDFISSKLELVYESDDRNGLNVLPIYSENLFLWLVKIFNIIVMKFKIKELEEKAIEIVEKLTLKVNEYKPRKVVDVQKNRPKSEIVEGAFKFSMEHFSDSYPRDKNGGRLNQKRGADKMYRGFCLD